MHKLTAFILLLFTISFAYEPDNINVDYNLCILEEIEIIRYKIPVIEDTKRQKRTAKKYRTMISELPPVEYTSQEISDYDEIITGAWKLNEDLKPDSSLHEYQWRNYFITQVNYPERAFIRGVEDSITIEFQTINQFIQDPVLIQGENRLLILHVFYALNQMPRLKLRDNNQSEKCRMTVIFKLV